MNVAVDVLDAVAGVDQHAGAQQRAAAAQIARGPARVHVATAALDASA